MAEVPKMPRYGADVRGGFMVDPTEAIAWADQARAANQHLTKIVELFMENRTAHGGGCAPIDGPVCTTCQAIVLADALKEANDES